MKVSARSNVAAVGLLLLVSLIFYSSTPGGVVSTSTSSKSTTSSRVSTSTTSSSSGGGSTTSTSTSSTSVGSTTATTSPGPQGTNRRLGFWLQESDISKCTWQGGYNQCGSSNPAQLFFNSMFLTPPYPSSLEIMIFAVLQAQTNSQGCTAASSSYISSSELFWGNLAQLANANPNIQLDYEIAFNPSNGGTGTYGLSCFNTLVQYFGQYSSVYGLGVEGEYTYGVTDAEMQTAQGDVNAVGKVFVNYYIHGPTQQWGYTITHTNFPSSTDPESTLGNGGTSVIWIDSGYYFNFPFPGSATCPISSSTSNVNWNQCTISTELSVAVSMPIAQRQFLELDPGFSSSGSFTGISGQSTTMLWDNPTLRNWIWTDPNYQGNFVRSS